MLKADDSRSQILVMSSPLILVNLVPELLDDVCVLVPFFKSVGRSGGFKHLIDLLILAVDVVLFVSLHPLARGLKVGASLLDNRTLSYDLVFPLTTFKGL